MDSVTTIDFEEDRLGKLVVDAAFQVHTILGPGLLESVYEQCLCEELKSRNVAVECQKIIPIVYKNKRIEPGLRIDLIVDQKIIIEAKATEKMLPVHEAQLLTYMKLSGVHLGYLINFNSPLIKDGIKRMVRRK